MSPPTLDHYVGTYGEYVVSDRTIFHRVPTFSEKYIMYYTYPDVSRDVSTYL